MRDPQPQLPLGPEKESPASVTNEAIGLTKPQSVTTTIKIGRRGWGHLAVGAQIHKSVGRSEGWARLAGGQRTGRWRWPWGTTDQLLPQSIKGKSLMQIPDSMDSRLTPGP